jgi:ribonuclease BN (tRNA processing enzyme)
VFFPGSSSVRRRFALEVIELAERSPVRVGPVGVTGLAVVHASGAAAYGLRLVCGSATVAYSGDTQWTDALVDVASGADVFICEAYVVDRPVKYHLSYADVVRNRDRLTCPRLVLTHLGPDMLAHQPELVAEIASDGYSFTI